MGGATIRGRLSFEDLRYIDFFDFRDPFRLIAYFFAAVLITVATLIRTPRAMLAEYALGYAEYVLGFAEYASKYRIVSNRRARSIRRAVSNKRAVSSKLKN